MPETVVIPAKNHTFARMFAYFVLIAMTIAMGFGTYWAFFNDDAPFSSTQVRITDVYGAERTEFNAGDTIHVRRKMCSTLRGLSALTVTRQLRSIDDGANYPLGASLNVLLEPGCKDTISALVIPAEVRSGRYEVMSIAVYRNNPFQFGATVVLPTPQLIVHGTGS